MRQLNMRKTLVLSARNIRRGRRSRRGEGRGGSWKGRRNRERKKIVEPRGHVSCGKC